MQARNASYETPLECAMKVGRLETVAHIAQQIINQNAQLEKNLQEPSSRSNGVPFEQGSEGNETDGLYSNDTRLWVAASFNLILKRLCLKNLLFYSKRLLKERSLFMWKADPLHRF